MSDELKQEKLEYANKLVKEFNDIIELAEQSTKTIDNISLYIEQTRIYFYGSLIPLIIVALILYVSMFNAFGNYLRGDFLRYPVPVIVMALSSFVAIISFYFTYTRISLLNRYRTELETEQEIHHRLLSLIDEQKRRVQSARGLSPVSMATFDMKIMRLSRGK